MKSIYSPFLIAVTFLILQSCQRNVNVPPLPEPSNAADYSSKVATEWMRTIEKIVVSEGKTPPVAARIYAYSAIGIYESVVPGMKGYQSLQGQIPGLLNLPNARAYTKLNYTTATNEAVFEIASKIFVTLKPENAAIIEAIHSKYYSQTIKSEENEVVSNSVAFGKMVAKAIIDRANNDNYAGTKNLTYVVPSSLVNQSNWSPTGSVQVPIEPFFGQVKCFSMTSSSVCTVKSAVPFSTEPGSAFYKQAEEVRTTTQNLTAEQKAIAYWWADGSNQNAAVSSHWLAIVDQIAEHKNFDLGKAAEIYAMVSISMADAFISCWDEKYKMNLLRPVSYVNRFVAGNANWQPLLSTPAMPEYPSSHSVASAAASDVLTHLLGNMSFTDSTNTSLGYQPRTFNSFTDAANEAAISRLYGGMHYRESIENGLKQGREVSKAVIGRIKMRI
jgi:hypothetical protein